MAWNTQIIFPTTGMGQLSDIYGTGVAASYTTGFPQGSGLTLGQGGLLFDMSIVNLLKVVSGTAPQYAPLSPALGFGNFYNVAQTNGVVNSNWPITAAYDRGGSTTLNASTNINIGWCTTRGLGTMQVPGSVNGNQALVPNTTTPGSTQAFTAGTNIFSNVNLLATTTTSGGYPVLFLQ